MKNQEKGIKTEWNLGLLYKNESGVSIEKQVEKDIKIIERACADFEKKYKKADFVSSPKKLRQALDDREALSEKIGGSKPWWYFALQTQLDSNNTEVASYSTRLEQRITDAGNKITFFDLAVAKIPKVNQKKFLNDKILSGYKYSLGRVFDLAKYNLSEAEEQIIDLLSQTSYGMWVEGQHKTLMQQTVVYKSETIPLTKGMAMLSDLPKKERHDMHSQVNEKLKSISLFAEAEINAVYNYKKVLDKRRGLKNPYSSTVLGNENSEKNILMLVDLVTKYFSISKRFYKLHAKLLNENKLSYADRAASIGQIKQKFDFNQAVSIVREVFSKIDQKYADIFDSFLEKGQIDVYPKVGKSGGAFCWGMGSMDTYVLLNHTDDIRSVETLAHEMGHAIHTELSKSQPPRYRKYSTATAEVASTFFEQAVTDELQNYLSKDEQLILLHNKIKGDVQTIFRQIACFNYELELHNEIREKGQVSKEEMAKLLSKHMQSYLGDVFGVTEDDGYSFVSWSHIRNFFYVYTYAYGQMVSRALFENWKKDPSYVKKIDQFLCSGRSMSPQDIFKKIGINTSDKAFFEAGLKGIEKDIEKLEKLSKSTK